MARFLIVSLLLASLMGCSGGATMPQSSTSVGFVPQRLVVHPLSSVRHLPDGSTTAQVYVQALDRDGFAARARGVIEVDVDSGDRRREAVMTRRSWTCDVSSDAQNRAHFDPMTRSYIVSLVLDPALSSDAMEVRAQFRLANGRVLTARGPLLPSGPPANPTDSSSAK